MTSIILTTLNARYIHASLGLRYLLANMGALQPDTAILEFTIDDRPIDIVERLLENQPRIIGFGIYIWNVEHTTKVVALLKQIRPDIFIVLGGPEVSYEPDQQCIVQLADYLVTGAADLSFAKLCTGILSGAKSLQRIIHSDQVPLSQIVLPYQFYTTEDIANRVIYVEASRGCPFKCEFCLSSLDKTAWPFELDRFLAELQALYERGVRQFKFVDRTFNLKIDISLQILEFFLQRLDEKLFLHFELIPDRLPEKLKDVIKRFPPGTLQFEIGIQSFNPAVQSLISRKQDNEKCEQNLHWLCTQTHAHLHTDLIVGLPGEDLGSFARGFNKLVLLNPHEIQVGILKRLRGTPIIRHTETFQIKYNPQPPYNILSSNLIDFKTMQRFNRFARYWDLIGNSGRFKNTKPILLGDSPFERFMHLSDWLFATTRQTHKIALGRLFELLFKGMTTELGVKTEIAVETLSCDYFASGHNSCLSFMDPEQYKRLQKKQAAKGFNAPDRQLRHLQH